MHRRPQPRSAWRAAVAALAFCVGLGVALVAPAADDAQVLRARHAALHDELAASPFQRPLVLESSDADGTLKGDLYARIVQPFGVAGNALQGADHWCEILMLHLNVQNCRARSTPDGTVLDLVAGSRYSQSAASAYRFSFGYDVVAARADYLQISLAADQGPVGTSRYRIVLEVVGLETGQSFLHMSYAYDYGWAARVAMQAYLATAGRSKVGFSVVGSQGNGQPQYVGGTRGVIERNTMRYYLAIEAYLGTLSLPPEQRIEQRLNDWYAGVERYPTQLHEIERDQYLELKHAQLQRQASGNPL